MSVATVTSKGQITIPKDVRDELKLVPGSKVMFVRLGDGDVRIVARTGKISDLAGVLHVPGRPAMTLEQMDDAIAQGAAHSGWQGSGESSAESSE